MPTSDPAKQLARELADLRREVRSGSRGSQARFRSLEGGSIPIYDSNGNLQGQVGVLPDGTTGMETVNGPKPPAPSAPIVFPTVGGLEIRWDGTFWEDAARPGDFRAIEVHASPYTVYTPDESTLRAALISTSSYFLQLPEQAWTITFVTRSTSGMLSDPSVSATETPEHLPTETEINDARQVAANAAETADAANGKALEAAGLAAEKGKVYYGTTAPAADPNGLWIDQTNGANTPKRHNGTTWVAVTDKAATDAATAAANAASAAGTALSAAQAAQGKADSAFTKAETAQTTADGKNKVFWRESTNPPPAPLIEGDLWFKTDLGNQPWKYSSGTWVIAQLADGAISGLNVGKLVSGQIAVGQRIIAGPATGTHAEMADDGFRVFLEDPVDGIPDEVVRMGTQSNDYFAIVGQDGNLKAAIDDTGTGNFAGLNVTGDPNIMGRRFTQWMSTVPGGGGSGTALPGARNYFGYNFGAFVNGVSGEFGLIEMEVNVEAGRVYWLVPTLYWTRSANTTYLEVKVRDGGTGAPSINSPLVMGAFFSGGDNPAWTLPAEVHRTVRFDTGGTHRLLLTVASGGGGTINVVDTYAQAPQLTLVDLGPDQGNPSSVNRGGGSTAPPVSQRFAEMGPAGWTTFRGDGSVRNDVPGPVQGWDPSGYNGDGWGYWWFNLPSITGTVDRVEFYAYSNHWYYNSGGTARMRAIKSGGGVITGYSEQGPFPKPGGRTVDLSGWNALFHNNQGVNRAIGIAVGPGGGTNLTYYGRFDGPSARLRLWFTQ